MWSATLTASSLLVGTGCENVTSGSECSSTSVLTDDDFRLAGSDYAITGLGTIGGVLDIGLDKVFPAHIKSGGTLYVDGSAFRLADATLGGDGNKVASWANTGLSWSVGQTVELRLTAPYWTGVDLYGGGLVHSSDGAQTLVTSESGSNFFLVRLDQAPTANVTVTLKKNFTNCSGCGKEYHGDVNAATVSPTTLTFTPSNYSTGQTVTVTGVADSDAVHDHVLVWAFVSIAGGADSDDPYRSPERVNGVWVTVWDGSDNGSDHGGL